MSLKFFGLFIGWFHIIVSVLGLGKIFYMIFVKDPSSDIEHARAPLIFLGIFSTLVGAALFYAGWKMIEGIEKKNSPSLTFMQVYCYGFIGLGTVSLFYVGDVETMVIRAFIVVFYIFCVCGVQALKNQFDEEAMVVVWPNQIYSYGSVEFPSYGSFAKYEQLSHENERELMRI